MLQSLVKHVIVFSILFTVVVSCDTEDPFSFPPPNFSTVPEAYDTNGIELEEIDEGVSAYIHDEGEGPFYVTTLDEVSVYITLRTTDDDIIYSSFVNENTTPVTVGMVNAGTIQNLSEFSSFSVLYAYSPGLKKGLLGMKEGEKRTIIVEPEQGLANTPEGHPNYEYRESTLIYDVLVSQTNPSKS